MPPADSWKDRPIPSKKPRKGEENKKEESPERVSNAKALRDLLKDRNDALNRGYEKNGNAGAAWGDVVEEEESPAFSYDDD